LYHGVKEHPPPPPKKKKQFKRDSIEDTIPDGALKKESA